MIYNIHYDVCAAIVAFFSIVFLLAKKNLRQTPAKILLLLFICAFFAAVFDISSSVVNSYVDKWSFLERDFHNYAYLFLHNCTALLFFLYTIELTGVLFGLRKARMVKLCAAVPFFLDIVLGIMNPFTGVIFYYDESKIYSHGPGMYVLYAVAFLYLLAAGMLLHKKGQKLEPKKRFMDYIFIAATYCAVVIQMFFHQLLLSLFIETLCLLGVLLVMDDKEEVIDPLTGLYNRHFFLERNISQLENRHTYSILLIRINQMNYHIATMGMEYVNSILLQIGGFLHKLNKNTENCYCDNGVFAIMYMDRQLVEELSEKVRMRFAKTWQTDGTELMLECQYQELNIPEDIGSIEELLLVVDADSGRIEKQDHKEKEQSTVYDYRRELAVERAILRALEYDEFEIYFQPVWNASNNMITAAEALMHLKDDNLGEIATPELMAVAEKKGHSVAIGERFFDHIISCYKERNLESLGIERIELKLTLVQCLNVSFLDRLREKTAAAGLENRHFGFEITTDLLSGNQEMVTENLNQLKKAGFVLSVDDFGNRGVDLMKLFEVDFDIIRIDKQMLWKAMKYRTNEILYKNTVRMAGEMSKITVAEGVEDVYQKELAQELGCDFLQGYYFSKPITEESFYRYCRGFNLR